MAGIGQGDKGRLAGAKAAAMGAAGVAVVLASGSPAQLACAITLAQFMVQPPHTLALPAIALRAQGLLLHLPLGRCN